MDTPATTDTDALTRDAITDALRHGPYPGLTRDLVSFGMVQHIAVCDGRVKVQLGMHTHDEKLEAQQKDLDAHDRERFRSAHDP